MSEQFGTLQEKQAFLKRHAQTVLAVELNVALPCATQNCTNKATGALVAHNPEIEAWELVVTCATCTVKLKEKYNEEERKQ